MKRSTARRGRTAGTTTAKQQTSPTRPNLPIERNLEANRPIGRGTLRRGDRRDTNRQFTTTNRHQPNSGDPLGSGKKQIQAGGKGLKNRSRKRK